MERFQSWVALTALSVVIISALTDHLPPSKRDGKENFALASACISLIFGFLFIVANLLDSLRNMIVGNVIENGEHIFSIEMH